MRALTIARLWVFARQGLRASVASVALLCSPVAAAVIVSTGAPPAVNAGSALDANQYLAAEFTLAKADTIRTVKGWIGGNAGQTINLRLYTGGTVPGSLLYAASFVTAQGVGWQGSDDLEWMLDAGDYWVSFEGTSDNFNNMASPAPNPVAHEAYWNTGNGFWVRADPLDLGFVITSDRRAIHSAVPEPASWAMMLLGFGVLGCLLRTRRKMTCGELKRHEL